MNGTDVERTSKELENKIVFAIGRQNIDDMLKEIIVSDTQYFMLKLEQIDRWTRKNYKHYDVTENELRKYLREQLCDKAVVKLKEVLLG